MDLRDCDSNTYAPNSSHFIFNPQYASKAAHDDWYEMHGSLNSQGFLRQSRMST
jgi:hypothetical protein